MAGSSSSFFSGMQKPVEAKEQKIGYGESTSSALPTTSGKKSQDAEFSVLTTIEMPLHEKGVWGPWKYLSDQSFACLGNDEGDEEKPNQIKVYNVENKNTTQIKSIYLVANTESLSKDTCLVYPEEGSPCQILSISSAQLHEYISPLGGRPYFKLSPNKRFLAAFIYCTFEKKRIVSKLILFDLQKNIFAKIVFYGRESSHDSSCIAFVKDEKPCIAILRGKQANTLEYYEPDFLRESLILTTQYFLPPEAEKLRTPRNLWMWPGGKYFAVEDLPCGNLLPNTMIFQPPALIGRKAIFIRAFQDTTTCGRTHPRILPNKDTLDRRTFVAMMKRSYLDQDPTHPRILSNNTLTMLNIPTGCLMNYDPISNTIEQLDWAKGLCSSKEISNTTEQLNWVTRLCRGKGIGTDYSILPDGRVTLRKDNEITLIATRTIRERINKQTVWEHLLSDPELQNRMSKNLWGIVRQYDCGFFGASDRLLDHQFRPPTTLENIQDAATRLAKESGVFLGLLSKSI